MRLLVLESTSLKEKAAASLEKRRQELEPEIKKRKRKYSCVRQMRRKKYAGLGSCPVQDFSSAGSV